jgi:DNA-binding LacI/PurR family transcriptional regulator
MKERVGRTQGQTQAIGLRQVAERAGVSIASASNVFSGKPWVSPDVRAAVLSAAAEVGFQPRRRAPAQPEAVSMLGFLIRENPYFPLATDAFYSEVLHAVEQACRERGLSLVHASLPPDVSDFNDLPPMIRRRQVQGLVVVASFEPAFYKLIEQAHLPWVVVDHFDESIPTDCITGRDEQGGYLATRHLLELGHRVPPPAMVVSPPHPKGVPIGPNFEARYRGYRRALDEFGVPLDPAYVSRADVGAAAEALLALPVPPTAIVCGNDPAALMVLNILQERGIGVPDQCSVVGYDDIYLAARAVPPLTTVHVDRRAMGRRSVSELLERIADPDLPARHTRLAVKLVQRQSAAPPAQQHSVPGYAGSAIAAVRGEEPQTNGSLAG